MVTNVRIKKDGTIDVRYLRKSVRNLVKELQEQKNQAELDAIKQMLLSNKQITVSDVNMMKQAGTQSVLPKVELNEQVEF